MKFTHAKSMIQKRRNKSKIDIFYVNKMPVYKHKKYPFETRQNYDNAIQPNMGKMSYSCA